MIGRMGECPSTNIGSQPARRHPEYAIRVTAQLSWTSPPHALPRSSVAACASGVETGRDNGMHALRHLYASVFLDAGESVKAAEDGPEPAQGSS